jgi:CubicO group peptidase (beta-lactamase class C family)
MRIVDSPYTDVRPQWLPDGRGLIFNRERDARIEMLRVDVPAGAAPASDAEIAEQVDSLMADATRHGFGGAVVIEREGRVLLSKGYGFANRRTRMPFSVETAAPIGSITKNFTALALVQLAAQGKVDLQASVRSYLTTASEPAASARLSDILVHHAGLAEYCGNDYTRRTKEELISVCTAQPLESTPGRWAYSNLGYSLLAAIVEQVSGQSWEDYLRDHVFAPAGMTHSGWMFADRSRMQFAEGYLDDKPRGVEADRIARLQGEAWNLKGNGGLQASAADMHRYYRFLMELPAAVREPMTTAHADQEEGVKSGYGLAFRIDRTGQPYRIGQGGSDDATQIQAYFMWLPQQRTFMYFVGNNGVDRVRPVLSAVLGAVQKGVGAAP